MLTQTIRRQFLSYFKERLHRVIPSSPVLPHDDPTLLFTNAGMNQFKDIFLGKSIRDYKRATTSQKCIRVGGKHNDLENVGHTNRHLTFFEMLGNFSFGDYFKKEAIQFAWEVSTQIFGFDSERIWPTVFRDDDEAFELWTQYVPPSRICRFDEKQNFWAMGDTGPCGPCSELLFDRGDQFGEAKNPLEDLLEQRYLEFWNLVFMQYNRDENGILQPLPKPSIDTGAGLERIVSLKMGVESVYETDVLYRLIQAVEAISKISYKKASEQQAAAFRVIADHLRCLAFAIADGVQPSNVDRGYVLRKVLRRAVRYGRSLGLNKPFLHQILPSLVESMGEDYPELCQSQERIEEILVVEEEGFIRTLRRGGNLLQQIIDCAQKETRKISGEEAFKLKDTYGFPLEEILLLAKDAALKVDTDRFQKLEEEAKERSRSVHKTTKQTAVENLFEPFVEKHGSTLFLGYEETETEAKVIALLKGDHFVDKLHAGEEGSVLLNQTPFYAEKGGQIGDTGILSSENFLFEVKNCQSPFPGIVVHTGKVEKGNLVIGETLSAKIDQKRRQKIANNHTATHLLHWALCRILGDHVKQGGSVVEPGRLRFDFSHHKPLTESEIQKIEDLINDKIRENLPVIWYELPFEEVIKRADIKQFFGEKYGHIVRVVDIDYSKELCGGTHTSRLGNIGAFRIAKEGSIASGIRRIEAFTGEEAEKLGREKENLLQETAVLLKTEPQQIKEKLEKLLEENRQLSDALKTFKKQQLQKYAHEILQKAEIVNGIPLLIEETSVEIGEIRTLAEIVAEKFSSGVFVLGAKEGEEKCQIIARVSDDWVKKGIKAHELIQAIAPTIEGSGGGKAHFAQAGGKVSKKIREALSAARVYLEKAEKKEP